jgi:hypothetical protein
MFRQYRQESIMSVPPGCCETDRVRDFQSLGAGVHVLKPDTIDRLDGAGVLIARRGREFHGFYL